MTSFNGFQLQQEPAVFVTKIPGHWLLARTTPSWRIKDPERGFQRIVNSDRARAIATAVLDSHRTFPSAIVLATDRIGLSIHQGKLAIPDDILFLVVDGQHRLWAQTFSRYEAPYACVIHAGLTEEEMAFLFLEINDNQRRVPSSLRWDLVRLVKADQDEWTVAAAEMVYELSEDPSSPLHQRIDRTGEQPEISLKQGSVAPGLRQALKRIAAKNSELSFNDQYRLIVQYLIAIRDLDPDRWREGKSRFYTARVLRALLRLLPDIIADVDSPPEMLTSREFRPFLERIDPESLAVERIRSAQGNAGIKAVYDQIFSQVFPGT